MPELPEVETIRRQLAPRLAGRVFDRVEVHDAKLTAPEPPEALTVGLPGRRVRSVERRGKYLLIAVDADETLVLHLRMTGRIHWRPAGEAVDERFLRALFVLDDGSTMTFGDARRFGRRHSDEPLVASGRFVAGDGTGLSRDANGSEARAPGSIVKGAARSAVLRHSDHHLA